MKVTVLTPEQIEAIKADTGYARGICNAYKIGAARLIRIRGRVGHEVPKPEPRLKPKPTGDENRMSAVQRLIRDSQNWDVPMTIKDLARRTGMTEKTISDSINPLVDRGLVTVETHMITGRKTRVFTTTSVAPEPHPVQAWINARYARVYA
jgi:DNA-binding HxlR family transcriptional regulator